MYKNYGDKNFFEYGLLIDDEHSATIFEIIFCYPYSDKEDLYQFGQVTIDINDDWIEWGKVSSFCGGNAKSNIDKAIMAFEYYGAYEFGGSNIPFYDWTRMTKEDIKKELRSYLIAHDNVCFD